MNNLFKILAFPFIIFCLGCHVSLHAQLINYGGKAFPMPDEPNYELINTNIGWQLGLGFGIYFPDKAPAKYYDGSRDNRLRNMLVNYQYNYYDLKEYFNHDFDLDTNYLPKNMRYTPALNLFFMSKYNFNENNGLLIEFSYAKLTTTDVFALTIDDPSNMTSEPTLELGQIWGKEERVNIHIGYIRTFGAPGRIKPFWEVGININDTKSKENGAQIAHFKYDIRDPHNTYYGYKEGGIGFGFFATQGIMVNISEGFAAHAGVNFSMKRIALQNEGAPLTKDWGVFIRLLYKNVFGSTA